MRLNRACTFPGSFRSPAPSRARTRATVMGLHGLPVGVATPRRRAPRRPRVCSGRPLDEYGPEHFGALRGGGLVGRGLSGVAELHATGLGGL
jgi:hypothetical protein